MIGHSLSNILALHNSRYPGKSIIALWTGQSFSWPPLTRGLSGPSHLPQWQQQEDSLDHANWEHITLITWFYHPMHLLELWFLLFFQKELSVVFPCNTCNTLSEETAHSTVYHHLNQQSSCIITAQRSLRWRYTVEWAIFSESVSQSVTQDYVSPCNKLEVDRGFCINLWFLCHPLKKRQENLDEY